MSAPKAQVHRFHDTVAVFVSDGEDRGKTVYFTPKDARRLSRALNACAKNIGAENFTKSGFSTVWIGEEPVDGS